jgi:hypothetical protein
MKPIVADEKLVAFCGLYCGACGAYLKGKCQGCRENAKATWCKVRACCLATGYGSCGDCSLVADLKDCRKLNNPISWVFSLIFRSDRPAGLRFIREKGKKAFAEEMCSRRAHAFKKG